MFEDGFRQRAGELNLGLDGRYRVIDFREQVGFTTFEQKVSVCRVVITYLDDEQTAYTAGLTDAPVLSALGAAPDVPQLAPSLDQLAAALGRYAKDAGKRRLVVFASGDPDAQRASERLLADFEGSKLASLADAATFAPTISTDVDLVVIIAPDVESMAAGLPALSDSIALALVTLSEVKVPTRDGLLRVVAFAESDPDVESAVVERWRRLATVGPACMRSRRDTGDRAEPACAPRFALAALGADSAVLAGAILGNDGSTATDAQVVERMLASDHGPNELYVASRRRFPIVQEQNGEPEYLGRF